MAKKDEWTEADQLQALRETVQKLEVIEREWNDWRAQSRTLTIELITKFGYSTNLAAKLSGHHRNTIKAWLDVYNADERVRRAEAAHTAPQQIQPGPAVVAGPDSSEDQGNRAPA